MLQHEASVRDGHGSLTGLRPEVSLCGFANACQEQNSSDRIQEEFFWAANFEKVMWIVKGTGGLILFESENSKGTDGGSMPLVTT